MKHIVAWAEPFVTLSWRTHCGKAPGQLDAYADALVWEPILADCEDCLLARSLALNAVRPAGKVAEPTNPLAEVERIARKHGFVSAEGKGNVLAWLDMVLPHARNSERGGRALVLLKELARLYSLGAPYSRNTQDNIDFGDRWSEVRMLLAEDVKPTQSKEKP